MNLLKGDEYVSALHEHHHHDCFQYTALGNSIAFGEGASFNVNDTEQHKYGYVYYFRDFLETIFSCVTLTNLAESGFTSSDLLDQLQTDNAREAVEKADLITISIGGGDLLDCIFPIPAPNLEVCLQNTVVNFTQNWPLIMKEIRKSIRSHAEIFVMTVYNPFIVGTPFFITAEPYIQGINAVIKANRSTFHYNVVDVHADFLGQFTNTTQPKVCIWTHSCTVVDPHPTDCGHLEIARLHELAYLKNHPSKLDLVVDDGQSSDESSNESSD